MRFSSLFPRPASPHGTVRGVLPRRVAGRTGGVRGHVGVVPPAPTLAEREPATDLPQELDARVRAIGEW